MHRAVFLDKDGTLIEDVPYSAGTPTFLPGVIDSLRRAQNSGFLLVVVTNQSGIAKGLMTRDDVDRQRVSIMSSLSENGVRLDGFYVCPHEFGCECRKPKPGLLFKASDQLNIDLGSSWMVGDKPTDVEAGVSAGCSAMLLTQDLSIKDAIDLICVLA